MASTQALIPWEPVSNNGVVATQENLHPKGNKWAVILNAFLSPSPGRTLDQVYTAAGKVLETHANRVAFKLGLGPHVIAGKIKLHFGDGEHRMQQLKLLRTTVLKKIEKQCLKLIKYSLPTESANMQCQAFKEIVDLATLLPGLRVLFLQTKVLDNVTSLDTISALWDRSTSPPDKEWTFWQKLATTCLADTVISAMTEDSPLADLVACHDEGLSIIEQLLVEHDCGASKYTSALCLRYLAGVLNLPGFWQNSGCAHAQVAHKLCCRMVQVLKDIGVDIPSLGLIEEDPVDYHGVDCLSTTILGGLSSWLSKLDRNDWANQPWYKSFTQVLQLLQEPRAGELLPCSSASATSIFEDILPTSYQDRVLNVMVDNQNHTVATEQSTLAANNSIDDLSVHSCDSDANQENSGQSIESLDDSQSQTSDLDSDEMEMTLEENMAAENHTVPTEQSTLAANNSIDNLPVHSSDSDANQENSGQSIESLDDSQSQTSDLDSGMEMTLEEIMAAENSDSSEEDDTVSDITGYEEQFGTALEHDPDVLGNLSNGSLGMSGISGAQTLLASAAYPSLEDRVGNLSPNNFEKFKHLGNSVLGLVVTSLVTEMYPHLRVGPATKVRAKVMGNTTLAEISVRYKLSEKLRLHPVQAVTLHTSTNVQADIFEAFIGGLYTDLEHDLAGCAAWLNPLLCPYLKTAYDTVRTEHGLAPLCIDVPTSPNSNSNGNGEEEKSGSMVDRVVSRLCR